MSRILTINGGYHSFSLRSKGNIKQRSNILSMKEKKTKETVGEVKKKSRSSLVNCCFFLAFILATTGSFYLYQVNDLATKGYEMKEAEGRIKELEKESKRMEIKEVELRSMYNIEKSTKELDLVNAQNITYIEMNSPVAMK